MDVYVVYGSPLSGKTTYVNKHKGPNDLIYDFDTIMSALTGKPIHEHNDQLIGYILDIRALVITRLKCEADIDNAWIITTRVTEDLKESLIGLNPKYIEMKVDIREVKKRLRNNPGNRDIKSWEEAINKYFTYTEDYSSFYKSGKWEHKRKVILKRDNFECQQSKRYGRTLEANAVHHIIPIKERPDLKLVNENLISLTEEVHNKMHKPDGTLSKLGKELRDRTIMKYPQLKQSPHLLQ